jgi:hypothetical protein
VRYANSGGNYVQIFYTDCVENFGIADFEIKNPNCWIIAKSVVKCLIANPTYLCSDFDQNQL